MHWMDQSVVMGREIFGPENLPYRQEKQMQAHHQMRKVCSPSIPAFFHYAEVVSVKIIRQIELHPVKEVSENRLNI